MKSENQEKSYFVYRVRDRLHMTYPMLNGAFIDKVRDELQPGCEDDLAVGWHITGDDGKPQTTEYPK